jgi:murein DD-endopeptidase MepM/ murein hydrolase activator NlpD
MRGPNRKIVVFAACAIAVLLLGSGRPLVRARTAAPVGSATPDDPGKIAGDACPEGTLPQGPLCVHLWKEEDTPAAAAQRAVHRERGAWRAYDQIPKLPERPASYQAYSWPVAYTSISSGYDLGEPDERQRRLKNRPETGHGGLDLMADRNAPVSVVALTGQEGPARVLYAGALFGTTVVTSHVVRAVGKEYTYLVLYGHLESATPGAAVGENVAVGTVLGLVGDSGSPGIVHLHLEVRRLREGVDLARVPAGNAFISDTVSVVCDPRNVIPLR